MIKECRIDLKIPMGVKEKVEEKIEEKVEEKEKPQITITEDDAIFLPQIPKTWLIVLFVFLSALTAFLLFIVMAD